MDIQSLGKAIQARRQATGLSQERLARLANLSRQTVHKLEAGTIKDLSFQRISALLSVLGLSFGPPSLAARSRKHGLWMAAKTSSVSYKKELTSETLQHALAAGHAPPGYEAQMLHFLDEAPVSLVVMAVEEAAQLEATTPAKVWLGVAKLARELDATRRELWS